MGTTITIASAQTTLTITGDRPYEGCTYDRLDGWYGIENVDAPFSRRPNAVGSFAPRQTFQGERTVSIEGDYFGASRADALAMRERIDSLYGGGTEVLITVADDLRTTSRRAFVMAVTIPWTIHQEFPFTIDLRAADPRRYAAAVTASTGLAAAGTGMSYPVVYPVDYGVASVSNRLVITNPGNAETVSRYTVTGGDMPDGFDIVNVATGQRISYVGPVAAGSTITIDTATRSAFINGTGPGSRYLSSPQWWSVPPGASLELGFLSRGSVSGNPTLAVTTAPAYY